MARRSALIVPTSTSYVRLPNVEFHGNGGHAHRRAPRHESAERRQHGLHRRSGDHAGGRHARWTAVSSSRPWPPIPSRPIPAACPGSSRERPAWRATAALRRNSTAAQNAPAGTQVGYLQDTGSMSQTVYLDAGTYQLSFLAAQRTTDQTNYQEIEVLVDGTAYGTIEPAKHLVCLLPVVDVYGRGRGAHHRVARREPPGRQQHRLHRSGVRLAGQRHQRRQFRDAGIGRGAIPICAHRFALATSRAGAGIGKQRQHLHLRQSQRTPTAPRSPSSRATAA